MFMALSTPRSNLTGLQLYGSPIIPAPIIRDLHYLMYQKQMTQSNSIA